MTAAAKVTERFRRIGDEPLRIVLTEDDPKTHTAPWTVKLNHFIEAEAGVMEYICLDNE